MLSFAVLLRFVYVVVNLGNIQTGTHFPNRILFRVVAFAPLCVMDPSLRDVEGLSRVQGLGFKTVQDKGAWFKVSCGIQV